MRDLSQAEWLERNHLESKQGEPLSEYIARCLALMAVRAGSKGGSLIATLARTAKISENAMQSAIQNRIALESKQGGSQANTSYGVKSIPAAYVPADPYDQLDDSPNIPSIELPTAIDSTRVHCRCQRRLISVDWSNMGIQGNPRICPKCRDLPQYCPCDQETVPF